MSHVAMVSIPFPGHVNPSLALIRELIRRGHRVTYANDPSYAEPGRRGRSSSRTRRRW